MASLQPTFREEQVGIVTSFIRHHLEDSGAVVMSVAETLASTEPIDVLWTVPAEQQNQVRSVLADSLRGVIAQTLCRRIGGGRKLPQAVQIASCGGGIGHAAPTSPAPQHGRAPRHCTATPPIRQVVERSPVAAGVPACRSGSVP